MVNLNKQNHHAIIEQSKAFCPSNIALAKYWGKQHIELNIPTNPSLSISLNQLGTEAKISQAENDQLLINSKKIPQKSVIYQRVFNWIRKTLGNQRPKLSISTTSNIPIAAGLASSASAFAAITVALNSFLGLNLDLKYQSAMARLGSASAARSIYSGFVSLVPQTINKQTTCFAEPIDIVWKELRLAIILVNDKQKAISSTQGMQYTKKTSPLFKSWQTFAKASFKQILTAITTKNFTQMGELSEHNAFTMHATMLAANPPLIYIQPESLAIIQQVQQIRKLGNEVYCTIDAGPNVKLLYQAKDKNTIKIHFPKAQIIQPF